MRIIKITQSYINNTIVSLEEYCAGVHTQGYKYI